MKTTQYFSSDDVKKERPYSFLEAVEMGIGVNGALFSPDITPLPQSFFDALHNLSFVEIATQVLHHLIGGDIPFDALEQMCKRTFSFPVELVQLDEKRSVLELFHGPTLAFKDFGAGFLAEVINWVAEKKQHPFQVIAATSGDTGSAVAQAFSKQKNGKVLILYPKGKVSFFQEQQLTTFGEQINAFAVNGTFDDCQRLVKEILAKKEELQLNSTLISANSIHIARLLPQCLYYFWAYKQSTLKTELVFSVPSGNFGNVCAGYIALKLGLPIRKLLVACNANKGFERVSDPYFGALKAVSTLSNAMDVALPSNWKRIWAMSGEKRSEIDHVFWSNWYDDNRTKETILAIKKRSNYVLDPHTAVGYLALDEYLKAHPTARGIVLSTAHPVKFKQEMKSVLPEIHLEHPLEEIVKNKKGTRIEIDPELEQLLPFLRG